MRSRRHHVVAFTIALATAMPAAAQTRTVDIERQRDAISRAREQQERQREAAARQREQLAERARQLQAKWPEVTEAFSRTLRLGRNGTLDLQNLAGNVIIAGGRGDDVRIDAVKKVRNPVESQARSLMRQLQIEVVERGGNVEVRTQYPRLRNAAGTVDYTISVPSAANVTVRSLSGDIRVTNVNGELRAEAMNGDVHASGVRRVRVVKTMAGNIQLADGESDELTASTMSGNLTVDNLKGGFFDLQSVTGHLRLINVQPERVNLRSMNGDIEYLGRLARSGRYEFQSHGGDIRVTPTNSQGFDVQARTFGGSFRSDYQLKITADSGAGRRGPTSRTIRGVFGDAGAAITAYTMNGDIVIVRR